MRKFVSNTTSFPIIMATLALMLLGLALSPLLKVKLLPDRSLPAVTIYYSYGGANAVVADSEVTSRLEAVFSNFGGLVNMRSRSGDGSGDITLEMGKGPDMDAVRFEVSMLIRQICQVMYSKVNYPLYLLADLNNQTGQNKKAIALAGKLMDKDIKVPSKAIEEIKEEM